MKKKFKSMTRLAAICLVLLIIISNSAIAAYAEDSVVSMNVDEIAVPTLIGINDSFKPSEFSEISTETVGIVTSGTEITMYASVTEGVEATFVGWFSENNTDSILLSTRPQYTFTFTGEHVYPIYEMNYLFKTDLDDGKITASGNTDANFSLEVMQDPTNSNKGKVLKVFTTNSGTWRTINLYYNNLYLYSRIGYEPNTYYTLNYKVYVENVTGDFSPETSLMVSSPGFSTFLANNNFANANSGVLYKDHYGTLPGMDNLKGVWRDYSITFYSGSYLQHEAGGYGVKEAINNSFQILGTAGFTLYIDDISWTKAVGIEAPASMQFEETSNIHDVYYDENFSFASYYEDEAYDRAIKYGEYSEFKIKDTKTNEYLDEVTVNGVAISADEETGLFGYLATEPLTFTKDYESGDHTTEIVSSAKWPEARTTTDENILLNKKPLIRYGSSLQSGKSFAIFNGRNDLTTGIISGQNMDIHSHYLVENGQMMKFAKADGTYRPIGELYLDITFNLGGVYEFNELWIASNIEKNYYTMGAYEVYISDTQDTLYDNENLYSEFDNHSSCWSGVTKTKFLGTKTGKYLGIRITQGVIEKNWSSSEIESTYARMREIAMLGVKIEDETEYTENSTEVSEISSYEWTDEDTGSVYNILKRKREPKIEYKTSLDKSANNIQGSGELVESIGTKAELTDDILYKNLDMYGHNLKQYNSAGGQYESMFFLKPDGSYRAPGELYVDVTYDLGGEYKLNELWLASEIASNSSYYKLGAFEVYVANDEETLYNENNKMAVFDSHDSIWSGYVKIDFLGEKYGSFLGIRITQGIVNKLSCSPWTSADVDSSYARISEIALFGETTVTSASLAETKIALKKGDTYNLVATAEPATANQVVYWTSSDESVAKVDMDGKVTCTGNGTAILTGVLDQFTFTCEVEGEYIPVTDITLSETAISAHPKDSIDLNQYITLAPENSTNKELEFVINNASVAEIEPETGILTTFAPGNALITIYSESRVYKQINLTVTYAQPTGARFYFHESPIYVNTYYNVYREIEPAGAYQGYTVQWNKFRGPGNIQDGYFYSEYDGTTEMIYYIVDSSGTMLLSGSIQITARTKPVEEISLDKEELVLYETGVNNNAKLNVTINPPESIQEVVWTSSNENVVTVSTNGQLMAQNPGRAIIKVASATNSNLKATCTVTVLSNDKANGVVSGRTYWIENYSLNTTENARYAIKPSLDDSSIFGLYPYCRETSLFRIHYVANGSYRIVSTAEDKALALIEDSNGNVSLKFVENQNSAETRWKFLQNSNGYFISNEKYPNLSLQGELGDSAESASITVGNDFQTWQLKTAITAIEFENEVMEILKGSISKIPISIIPVECDEELNWMVLDRIGSDAKIASIDSDGVLHAKETGWVDVGVSNYFDTLYKECIINICDYPEKLTLNKNKTTIFVGESESLVASFGDYIGEVHKTVWTSSNNDIATVQGGKIKAKSAGTVTITATSRHLTASCKVTVKDPSLKPAVSPVDGAIYRIQNAKSDKVLEVPNEATSENTVLSQSTRNNQLVYQKFKISLTEWGYKIVPMHTEGKLVALNNNNHVVIINENNTQLKKRSQKYWEITPAGGENYYISNKATGKRLTMAGQLDNGAAVECTSVKAGSKWKIRGYEVSFDNIYDQGMLKLWSNIDGDADKEEISATIENYMQIVAEFFSEFSPESNIKIKYNSRYMYSCLDQCNSEIKFGNDELDINCDHDPMCKDADVIESWICNRVGYDFVNGKVPILWTGHSVKEDGETSKDFGWVPKDKTLMVMASAGAEYKLSSGGKLGRFANNPRALATLLHEMGHLFNTVDTYCDLGENGCENSNCGLHYSEENGYADSCLMGNYDGQNEIAKKIFDGNIENAFCQKCREDIEDYLLQNY